VLVNPIGDSSAIPEKMHHMYLLILHKRIIAKNAHCRCPAIIIRRADDGAGNLDNAAENSVAVALRLLLMIINDNDAVMT
jgi:hypothetical protein